MENELEIVKMDDVEGPNGHNNPFSSNSSNKIAGYGGAHNPKWTDEAIKKLIKLWGERPSLYDTKNESYFSKNKRREAMEEICEEMDMAVQDIQLKMISLRTYYGAQHRKKLAWENDSSKKTPFTSRWQFWIPLQFLQNHITQKQSENKCSLAVDEEGFSVSPEMRFDDVDNEDGSRSIISKPRGTKRKIMDRVSSSNFDSNKNDEQPEEIVQRKAKIGIGEKMITKSEDELFVSVLLKSLAKIEEGEAKEALKLEIQNLVFRTRFGPQRFLGGPNEALQSFGSDYFSNGSYATANEFGTHRNNLSDEELSMTSRRKAMNPKKSAQNDSLKESCSMVTVQHRYPQSDRGEP